MSVPLLFFHDKKEDIHKLNRIKESFRSLYLKQKYESQDLLDKAISEYYIQEKNKPENERERFFPDLVIQFGLCYT